MSFDISLSFDCAEYLNPQLYMFIDTLGEECEGTAYGSCVLIEHNGEKKFLSCYHIPGNKPIGQIRVFISNGDRTIATKVEVEKYDSVNDLLLLRPKKKIPFEGAKIAEAFTDGEKVYFGGYSAFPLPKIRVAYAVEKYNHGIYLDPIYFGDSGGGCFNADGELLGIIYKTYSINDTPTLVGYATPLKVIREFLN